MPVSYGQYRLVPVVVLPPMCPKAVPGHVRLSCRFMLTPCWRVTVGTTVFVPGLLPRGHTSKGRACDTCPRQRSNPS